MRTPPALIRKVIQSHGLNTLAAYDQAERLRLYYIEAAPDELIEHLDDLTKSLDGTFMVKAWRSTKGEKAGRRRAVDATYSWLVAGMGRKESVDAPISGASTDTLPAALIAELADLRADRMARERLDAMQMDDEEEEEDVPQDPMVGKLVEMLSGFLMRPAAGAPAPVTGTERGHPHALQGERLEAIIQAIRNLHSQDPTSFSQYESALISNYGKAS